MIQRRGESESGNYVPNLKCIYIYIYIKYVWNERGKSRKMSINLAGPQDEILKWELAIK